MTTGLVHALPLTRLVAIAAACLVALLLPITAAAEGPGAACTFSGIVTLNNAEVADDSLVTAIIAGDEYTTYTPTDYGYSTYSLTISAPEGRDYPDGTEVTFKVNGYAADQTGIFQAGADLMLDLKASASGVPQYTPVPVDTSSAAFLRTRLLVFAGFAVLVAVGVVYSFMRRRENRRILMSIRDKYARAAYSSLEEDSKQALPKPSFIDQQPRSADTEKKPRFEQLITHPSPREKSKQVLFERSIMDQQPRSADTVNGIELEQLITYPSRKENSKQALPQPSVIDQQPRNADTGNEPELEQPITYPEGVMHALEVHGFDLQDTTPVNLMVWCPACRGRFQIWVPSSWSVARRAHSADGMPSYGKRARTKLLFEFDLVCPEGHRLHLAWTWK